MNLVEKLKELNMTISTAESITGGLIASTIVNMAGASNVFNGGVVAYTKESKCSLLDMTMENIEKYGVYSHETAKGMALGIKEKTKSNIAVSTTGVAGPGSDENVKAGTVYYCFIINDNIYSKYLSLDGDRNTIRRIAVTAILADLDDVINNL